MSGSGRAGLEAVIERMEGLRVLVVGDLMLDEQSGLEQIYAILRQATASPP